MYYDKVIIGAGLYGLYSALFCAKKGDNVLVLEYDDKAFGRATYINQARVHMGYHYPRSISTALKSRGYFDRFTNDYGFCILKEFEKVYATSGSFSWTNGNQFKKFCSDASIRCEQIDNDKYFKPSMCDGTFITTEYTYDAMILKNYFLEQLDKMDNVKIKYKTRINTIKQKDTTYEIDINSNTIVNTPYLLNATYASVNQIHDMLGFEKFKIKYELCEIILCKVSDNFRDVGITVMDGPFFSIMPFGKTGLHSLTSVTFTPHITSFDLMPTFYCQQNSKGYCSKNQLGNCNNCSQKPKTSYDYMANLARKYLKDEYKFEYVESLFSMKLILKASEIDDSRPTVIKQYTDKPVFVSVLSGKINTIYDLDEVLEYDR